jgi:hypothetical protein
MNHWLLSIAQIEVGQAALWYEGHCPGAGERFLVAFDAALAEIVAAPDRYAFFPGAEDARVRYRQLVGFPYVVLYKIAFEEIVITSVTHAARLK